MAPADLRVLKPGACLRMHWPSLTASKPSEPPAGPQSLRPSASIFVAVALRTSIVTTAAFACMLTYSLLSSADQARDSGSSCDAGVYASRAEMKSTMPLFFAECRSKYSSALSGNGKCTPNLIRRSSVAPAMALREMCVGARVATSMSVTVPSGSVRKPSGCARVGAAYFPSPSLATAMIEQSRFGKIASGPAPTSTSKIFSGLLGDPRFTVW
mmetsp:Transcript_6744/g.14710  ORF Transcript_6744/g.14710 Transcript_6744/m.14710 type:complete len:213 (-) Transcript_6744:481-1119(-)